MSLLSFSRAVIPHDPLCCFSNYFFHCCIYFVLFAHGVHQAVTDNEGGDDMVGKQQITKLLKSF